MTRLPLFVAVSVALFFTSETGGQAPKEQPNAQTIPLDRIWAYDMPGTREIEESAKPDGTKLLESIFQSWDRRADPLNQDMPRSDFAVSGSGLAALRAAHAVITKGAPQRVAFSPDEEITLAFISELMNTKRTQIGEVQRRGDHVIIQYRLTLPVRNGKRSANFALIPLGKLPVGKFTVETTQLRLDHKFYDKSSDELRRILYKPFSFSVAEGIIPLDQIWAYEMPGTRELLELTKGETEKEDQRLFALITESWFHRVGRLKFKDAARPGFAVAGSGHPALRAALAAFVRGKPCGDVSSKEEVTIVFFSEPAGRCVEVRQVKRVANQVEIQYSLRPEHEGYRFNFALIPLQKIPAGEYRVEMRQIPRELTSTEIKLGFKPLDNEWSGNFLCKPFNFTVTGKSK